MKKIALVFGILFLLISCEKQVDELNDSQMTNDDNVMLKSGKPDQPGENMKVFRYEKAMYFYFTDWESNLVALVGVDVWELCATGFLGRDTFDLQEILVHEGDLENEPRVIQQIKGKDLRVLVWEINPEGPSLTCPYLTSTEPLFDGTGHMVYTENDLYSYARDGQNHNVWGCTVNGKGVSIKYHAGWDGEDMSTYKENIRIKLK